jgi:hypothetical protein
VSSDDESDGGKDNGKGRELRGNFDKVKDTGSGRGGNIVKGKGKQEGGIGHQQESGTGSDRQPLGQQAKARAQCFGGAEKDGSSSSSGSSASGSRMPQWLPSLKKTKTFDQSLWSLNKY